MILFTKIVVCFVILGGGITPTTQQMTGGKPSTQVGMNEFRSKSLKPSVKVNVLYQVCLPTTPTYVIATAKASDTSSTLRLKLTVIKIMKYSFLVQLERTDQYTGWDAMVTVKWTSLTGGEGIVYDDQYIWLQYTSKTKVVTKAKAENLCHSSGARLLDIKDRNMYDAVFQYVKATYVSNEFANIWLAMKYNITTGAVTQSTGLPGFNGVWHEGYPKNITGYTAMRLQVPIATSRNKYFGLWNDNPKIERFNVLLCTYNV